MTNNTPSGEHLFAYFAVCYSEICFKNSVTRGQAVWQTAGPTNQADG